MEAIGWETTDLRLGAYLRMVGFKIKEVRKSEKNVIFTFEDRDDRAQKITEFYNKESKVEPLAFMASISEMRDMITQAERTNGSMARR